MSPRRIAELIATGHAYQKHVVLQMEFPEIESITAFVDLVQHVIVSGRKKTIIMIYENDKKVRCRFRDSFDGVGTYHSMQCAQ